MCMLRFSEYLVRRARWPASAHTLLLVSAACAVCNGNSSSGPADGDGNQLASAGGMKGGRVKTWERMKCKKRETH